MCFIICISITLEGAGLTIGSKLWLSVFKNKNKNTGHAVTQTDTHSETRNKEKMDAHSLGGGGAASL